MRHAGTPLAASRPSLASTSEPTYSVLTVSARSPGAQGRDGYEPVRTPVCHRRDSRGLVPARRRLGLARLNVGRLLPSVGVPSIDPRRSADKQKQREDSEQDVAKQVMHGLVDRPVPGVDRLDPVV